MLRTLLILLSLSIGVASCQRSPAESGVASSQEQAANPPNDGATPGAPASAAPAALEAAPATISAPLLRAQASGDPVEARRPDSLIAILPAGDVLVAIDLEALDGWADIGLHRDTLAQRVRETVSEALGALAATIEPGATLVLDPQTRAIAFSWDAAGLRVALDTAPTAFYKGVRSEREGVHLVRYGSAGSGSNRLPERLPQSALLTAVVRQGKSLPAALSSSLHFLELAEIHSFAAAIEGNGALSVLLEDAQPGVLSLALGKGQVYASQALGQLNRESSAQWQGWISWLNRISQAAFGRVQLQELAQGTLLQVPPPACGGPFRNLVSLALVLELANVASRDPSIEAIPYVAMEVPLNERCEPMAGPPPSIPVSMARWAPVAGSQQGVLVVVDFAGLLRLGLPTGFGLLPFALPDEAIEQSFGRSPMGLASLAADNAAIAYSRTGVLGSGGEAQQALILPASMVSWVAGSAPILGMQPFLSSAEVGYASPGFEPLARFETEPRAAWTRAIQSLPQGTVMTLLMDSTLFAHLGASLPADNLFRSLFDAAEVAVIAVRAEGVALGLVGIPTPTDVEKVRQDLPVALLELLRPSRIAPQVDSAPLLAELVDLSTVIVQGDTVWLDLEGATSAAVALGLQLGAPLAGEAIRRGPIQAPFPTQLPGFPAP